jgi:DNA-binding transcriptional ArsR family regulator/GNAT superfamily N-acetyltransferase
MPTIDEVFKALGDPIRIKIVDMLARNGEMCVGEMLEHVQVTQPAVSHHLSALKYAGLVHARKDGQWVRYTLSAETLHDIPLAFLQGMLDELRSIPAQIIQPMVPDALIVESLQERREEFERALVPVYLESPCQVLPWPLWKTLLRIPEMECTTRYQDGKPSELIAWAGNGLEVAWSSDRCTFNVTDEQLHVAQSIVVHDDYLNFVPMGSFPICTPYFRLIRAPGHVDGSDSYTGLLFAPVDTAMEIQNVYEFMTRCCEDPHLSPEAICAWAERAVFKEDLWVWALDTNAGVPAALGIADLDDSMREGSVEWVTVLPEYRRRGIGKTLVFELLNRLDGRADFVTVFGEENAATGAESLFKSCGFEGENTWWFLRI